MNSKLKLILVAIIFFLSLKATEGQKKVIVNQKLILTSEYLGVKQFNKKRFGDAFRSCRAKRCQFDRNLRFGAVEDGGFVIMIMNNDKKGIKPMVKKVAKVDFTQATVQDFMNAYILKISDGQYCDRCVNSFVNYYSNYVTHMQSFDTHIFQHQSTNPSVKPTPFVVDIPYENTSQVLTFPDCVYDDNAPCTTYKVTSATATLPPDNTVPNFGDIYLPDNFTITVDPSVTSIHWVFSVFTLGSNVEFDLSQRAAGTPSTPATPPKAVGAGFPPNCYASTHANPSDYNFGATGPNGAPGAAGTSGANGANLIFHADNITAGGNVWVRTDGQNGGTGGTGGTGADGALGWCGSVSSQSGSIDAGQAGSGGPAGPAGNGGNVSFVSFTSYDPNGNLVSYMPLSSTGTTPSAWPTGTTGQIVIYGNPGLHGNGGTGGAQGTDGLECECGPGSNIYDCASGSRGTPCSPRGPGSSTGPGTDGVGIP